MNWIIEYVEGQRYVSVVCEGLFSAGQQIAAIEHLLSRKFWHPGMPILFDHRKLDFGNTNISIFRQISMFHQKNDARIGAGRIALPMKSLSDFGRGRQFELLCKGKISAKLEYSLRKKKP
jgi:hypothetical protein